MKKPKPTLADTGSIVPRIQTAYLWEQLAAKPNSRVTEMGQGADLHWIVRTNQGERIVYAQHSSRLPGLIGAVMLLQAEEQWMLERNRTYGCTIDEKGFSSSDLETAILSAYAMSLEEGE
jgi:hypothetical protein